jgi:hypothetical protein
MERICHQVITSMTLTLEMAVPPLVFGHAFGAAGKRIQWDRAVFYAQNSVGTLRSLGHEVEVNRG